MITKVDHIDLRVVDFEKSIETLSNIGLVVKRRTPAPRCSVEMALPGENQVVFEIHPAIDGQSVVHHIAFRQTSEEDGPALKEKDASLNFLTLNKKVAETGRTVSTFKDANGLRWQLTD